MRSYVMSDPATSMVFAEVGVVQFAGEIERCAWCGEILDGWAWIHPACSNDEEFCSIRCCSLAWAQINALELVEV